MENAKPLGSLLPKISELALRKTTPSSNSNGLRTGSETGARISGKGQVLAVTATGSGVPSPAAMLRNADAGYLQVQRALETSLPLRPLVRNGVEVGWLAGWDLKPGTTKADLQEAARLLTAWLSPCPEATVDSELVRLSMVAKQRNPDSADLMLEEYGRRLREYPKDVVVDALRYWPDGNTFFPSWNELHEELEWRVSKRRAMKQWVENELDRSAR